MSEAETPAPETPAPAPKAKRNKTLFTKMRREAMNKWERRICRLVLMKNNGIRKRAARALGLDRANFIRLLRKHGLIGFMR